MSTTAPIRSWRQAGVLLLVMMALGCWPAWAALAPPDPAHGEEVYVRCQACHALAQDRVGPRHCGVVGVSRSVPRVSCSTGDTTAGSSTGCESITSSPSTGDHSLPCSSRCRAWSPTSTHGPSVPARCAPSDGQE